MARTIRKGRRKSKRRMDRSVRKITRRSRKSGRRTRRKVRRSDRKYQVGGMEGLQKNIQQTQTLIQSIQAEVNTSRRSSATHLHVCYKGSDKCNTIDIRGLTLSDFIGDIVFARCDLKGMQGARNTFAIHFVELVFDICNIVAEAEAGAQQAAQQAGPILLRELGPVAEKLMNKLCGIEFPSIFKLMFSHDTLQKTLRQDMQKTHGEPAYSGTSPTFFERRGGISNVLNQPLETAFNITTLSIPTLEKSAQDLEQTALSAVEGMSQPDTDVEQVVASELQKQASSVGNKGGKVGQIAAAAGLAGVGALLATFPPLAWASPMFLAGAASAALNTYNSRKSVTSTLQQEQLSGGLINMCLGEMYFTKESDGRAGSNFYDNCVQPRIVECIPNIPPELLVSIRTRTLEAIRTKTLEGARRTYPHDFLKILDNFRYSKYEVIPPTPERQTPKLYVKEITIKDKGPHTPPTVYHETRRNMKGKAEATHIIVRKDDINKTLGDLTRSSADHRFKVTVTFGDLHLIRGLECLNFLEEGIAAETDYIVYLVDGKKTDQPVFPEFNTVHDYMPLINSRSVVDFYKQNIARAPPLVTIFKVKPTNGKVLSGYRDYWRPDMCGYGEFTFAVPDTCIRHDFMNVKSLKRRIQNEIYSRLHENKVRFRLGVVGYSHLTPYQDGYGRVKDIGGVKAMIENNSHPLIDHLDINDLGSVLSRLSIHTEEDAALSRGLPNEDILENARDLMVVLEEVTETLNGRSFSEGSPLSMIEETSVLPGFMSIKQIYEKIQTMIQSENPRQFGQDLEEIETGLGVYESYIDTIIAQHAPESVATGNPAAAAEAGPETDRTDPSLLTTLINIQVTIPKVQPKVQQYRWYDIIYYTEDTDGVIIPLGKHVGASLSTHVDVATMPLHCFTKPFFTVMELVDTLREIYDNQSQHLTRVLSVLQGSSGTRDLSEKLEAARKARNIPRPYKECCTVCVPQSYRNPPPPYCSVSLPCVEKYELKFTGMFKAIMEPLTFGINHSGYATSELGIDVFSVRNSIIQHALYDMTQLATKLAEIGRQSLPEEGGAPTHAYDTFIAKMSFSLSCLKPDDVMYIPERVAEDILNIRRILKTVKPTQGVPVLEYWAYNDPNRGIRYVTDWTDEVETLIENGDERERLLDISLAAADYLPGNAKY